MPFAQRRRPIVFINYAFSLMLALVVSGNPLFAQEDDLTQEETENVEQESSSASSTSDEPPLSRTLRNQMLLAESAGEESVWLDTEQGKILARHRISESSPTFGVLLLLHAAEDPEHWPPALENLRTQLPRYGWETLALALPAKKPAPPPQRPSSSSTSSTATSEDEETSAESTSAASAEDESSASLSTSSASSTASLTREQQINGYVEAVMAYFDEKELFNRVILVDNSAAYAAINPLIPLLGDNPKDHTIIDGPMQALIIANLQPQEPLSREELEAIFHFPALPILDLFWSPESKAQLVAQRLHRGTAKRLQVKHYQSLNLPPLPAVIESDGQSFLLGRVRGFIQRHAKGSEVKLPFNNNQDQTTRQ